MQIIVRFIDRFVDFFLGNFLDFGVKWPKGDNLWAVITGGTDGIGLEYAKELVAKGFL